MAWALRKLPSEWVQALLTDMHRAMKDSPRQAEWVTLMMADAAMKPYFARLGRLHNALASLEQAA